MKLSQTLYIFSTVQLQFLAKTKTPFFSELSLSHDILCLHLMLCSSGSMVFILHRHQQQKQHIHRHNSSSHYSQETRASQSILILVCTIVFFYDLSITMKVCFTFHEKAAWWLIKISASIHVYFSKVAFFIFMSPKQCIWSPMWKK